MVVLKTSSSCGETSTTPPKPRATPSSSGAPGSAHVKSAAKAAVKIGTAPQSILAEQ
jgi:hypothetical protein